MITYDNSFFLKKSQIENLALLGFKQSMNNQFKILYFISHAYLLIKWHHLVQKLYNKIVIYNYICSHTSFIHEADHVIRTTGQFPSCNCFIKVYKRLYFIIRVSPIWAVNAQQSTGWVFHIKHNAHFEIIKKHTRILSVIQFYYNNKSL